MVCGTGRECVSHKREKKIIFKSVPTKWLHAPAVVEFLQLIQRVKHTIAENELAAKVFSELLKRSVSLESYNLNLSVRPWVCSLYRSGASPELELNEETGWVRTAELGSQVDRIRTDLEVILALFFKLKLLKSQAVYSLCHRTSLTDNVIPRNRKHLFTIIWQVVPTMPKALAHVTCWLWNFTKMHRTYLISDDQYFSFLQRAFVGT